MKKQQKIIELRRAAKLKVSELETKIAFARSESAKKRASLMMLRADELEDTKTETERFDVIAYYRALFSDIEAGLTATVANLKADIQQTKAECERQCAAAEDDPDPAKEQPQQETVYVDGSEHAARIVARRLINKMPHIPRNGYLNVHVVWDTYGDNQEYFVSVSCSNRINYESEIFSAQRHTAELEAAFVKKVRRLFAEEPESGNSHVAEPMARALDAVFGGNPMEQVDNLIADTIKDGKEGGNE